MDKKLMLKFLDNKRVIRWLLIFLLFILSIITTFLFLYVTAPRVPLLGFHSIIDFENPNFKITQNQVYPSMVYAKQDVEEFLEYLITHNYWFLSTQELYEFFVTKSHKFPVEHMGQKPIMLSFDDGYKTIHTSLLPVLEKLEKKYNKKIKVVLFINPGTLENSKSPYTTHLGCQELREGLGKGYYDIQSHGLNHKNLTKINSDDLITELYQAQTQLRSCTAGLDPESRVGTHLAYPYGAYNAQVEAYASKYYLSGYLYNSKILRFCWLKNRYRISRLTVNRDKSPSRLIQMAEKSYKITAKGKC